MASSMETFRRNMSNFSKGTTPRKKKNEVKKKESVNNKNDKPENTQKMNKATNSSTKKLDMPASKKTKDSKTTLLSIPIPSSTSEFPWLMVVAIILIVLCILLFVYFFFASSSTDNTGNPYVDSKNRVNRTDKEKEEEEENDDDLEEVLNDAAKKKGLSIGSRPPSFHADESKSLQNQYPGTPPTKIEYSSIQGAPVQDRAHSTQSFNSNIPLGGDIPINGMPFSGNKRPGYRSDNASSNTSSSVPSSVPSNVPSNVPSKQANITGGHFGQILDKQLDPEIIERRVLSQVKPERPMGKNAFDAYTRGVQDKFVSNEVHQRTVPTMYPNDRTFRASEDAHDLFDRMGNIIIPE